MASRFPSRVRIIALAAWHSIRTLGRRKAPTNPRRILIAHHLLLGDTLMLTPLLAKLRELHPAAEIVMTTPKAVAPLYEKRPYGVRAIPYDPRDPVTLQALYPLHGFDLAIVPGDNRHAWLARALGAGWVIAHAGDRPAYKDWAVDERVPYPAKPAAWGDMVAELAAGRTPAPYRPTDWPQPAHAAFPLPETPYCVLHVGASSPLKLWNNEKWLSLAEYLSGIGYHVVWSGGKGEDKYISAIDPQQKFISYAGKLDLPQVWQLIKHAALLVCPDTGIAHLGRLVNTPTITLFGPGSDIICGAGNFWQNAPYRTITVPNFRCRNQHKLFRREIAWVQRCGRNPEECSTPACMHGITLDTVKSTVRDLLNNAR
jgi:ADP-heptose:LPS heptosyltransferase